MLEAKVHEQLRAFLRHQGRAGWPHHLTMARLAARALRLGRSSLMQVGSTALYQGHYRLSYLMSLLMWPGPAILVLPESMRPTVQHTDIPLLQEWMPTQKPVHYGDSWPGADFQGILLTTPQAWLCNLMAQGDRFPANIPVVIDSADNLEDWVRDCLTTTLDADAWQALTQAYPHQQNLIRDTRVSLTRTIFQHPPNPYHCHLIDAIEQQQLITLQQTLLAGEFAQSAMPLKWRRFWQQLDTAGALLWVKLNRQLGQWTLHSAPIDVASTVAPYWQQQPIVLIGGALDISSDASHYRQRLGLGEMTCLKFGPDRQTEEIQLYLPDGIPFPNTPEFQPVLLEELSHLVLMSAQGNGLTVVLVGDTPLKQQVATVLAAQFGSRVQLEHYQPAANAILVCGWRYWREHQIHLPRPQLLAIATLPIPSLEDPLVAGRVAYYKRCRQDWFRLYLLPTALHELQQAIAPARHNQSLVALLDNRVNHRSYGRQILDALSPVVRLHQRHALWLTEVTSGNQHRQGL